MNTAITTKQTIATPGQAIKTLLAKEEYSARLKEVLGTRAAQFAASLIAVANRMPPGTDPKSVLSSAMTAACLDLPIEPSLGFAHIVPYKDKAQFQIGYKGLIQLALRSGQYKKMNASPINKEAYKGRDEVGDPIIDWNEVDITKEPVGYAVAWQTVNGFTKTVYWTKEAIINHAARYSQAYKSGKQDSPWFTNFAAMALKTVIKYAITHWGIMSVQMQTAIHADNVAEAGEEQDEAIDVMAEPVLEPAKQSEPEPKPVSPEPVQVPSAEKSPKTPKKQSNPKPQKDDNIPFEFPEKEQPAQTPPPVAASDDVEDENVKKLTELMEKDGVSFDKIRNYAMQMGHIPETEDPASVKELPPKIVALYVKAWRSILNSI